MKTKESYFQMSLTVDVVLFTVIEDNLKLLLIKRSEEPFKDIPALPGGFVNKTETTEEAALRILKNKAGVTNIFIEQLYTFDSLDRDPRGQIFSVTYFALVPYSKIKEIKFQGQDPAFVSVEKLPRLAFDHTKIVNYAIKRVQAKIQYTNTIYSLLPNSFSLNQLQKTYEAILCKKIDKRNFQKKFLQLGLLKPTKKMLTGGRQRPARLYEFKSKKPVELQKFL